MTDRQRAFLAAYLADPRRNATRAAASAGYAWPAKQGARLKTFPRVAESIRSEEERQLREWETRRKAERLAERKAERKRQREWVPPKGSRGRYRRRRWTLGKPEKT